MQNQPIITKELFLNSIDKYIDELLGLEKFFRCLREQTEVFRQNAAKKIPDATISYKEEVKDVVKEILKSDTVEKLDK